MMLGLLEDAPRAADSDRRQARAPQPPPSDSLTAPTSSSARRQYLNRFLALYGPPKSNIDDTSHFFSAAVSPSKYDNAYQPPALRHIPSRELRRQEHQPAHTLPEYHPTLHARKSTAASFLPAVRPRRVREQAHAEQQHAPPRRARRRRRDVVVDEVMYPPWRTSASTRLDPRFSGDDASFALHEGRSRRRRARLAKRRPLPSSSSSLGSKGEEVASVEDEVGQGGRFSHLLPREPGFTSAAVYSEVKLREVRRVVDVLRRRERERDAAVDALQAEEQDDLMGDAFQDMSVASEHDSADESGGRDGRDGPKQLRAEDIHPEFLEHTARVAALEASSSHVTDLAEIGAPLWFHLMANMASCLHSEEERCELLEMLSFLRSQAFVPKHSERVSAVTLASTMDRISRTAAQARVYEDPAWSKNVVHRFKRPEREARTANASDGEEWASSSDEDESAGPHPWWRGEDVDVLNSGKDEGTHVLTLLPRISSTLGRFVSPLSAAEAMTQAPNRDDGHHHDAFVRGAGRIPFASVVRTLETEIGALFTERKRISMELSHGRALEAIESRAKSVGHQSQTLQQELAQLEKRSSFLKECLDSQRSQLAGVDEELERLIWSSVQQACAADHPHSMSLSHSSAETNTYKLEMQRRELGEALQHEQQVNDEVLEEIKRLRVTLRARKHARDDVRTHVEVLEQALRMIRKSMEQSFEFSVTAEAPDSAQRRVRGAARRRRNFVGRGSDSSVPIFLRHEGMVPNLGMTKAQAEVLVKEIWSLKTMADNRALQRGGRKLDMQLFFYRYCKSKSAGSHARAIVFAYNLVDALERFSYDADLELFHHVLMGELGEAIYYDQMSMLAHLKRLLREWQSDSGSEAPFIPLKLLMAKLTLVFPHKTAAELEQLREAAIKDQRAAELDRPSPHLPPSGSSSSDESDDTLASSVVLSESEYSLVSDTSGVESDAPAPAPHHRPRTLSVASSVSVRSASKSHKPIKLKMAKALQLQVNSSSPRRPQMRPRDQIAKISSALERGLVSVAVLTHETAEGDESEFVEAMRDQYLSEARAFKVQVKDSLEQTARAEHKARHTDRAFERSRDGVLEISTALLMEILRAADPHITGERLEDMVECATQVPREEQDPGRMYAVPELFDNLKRGLLVRSDAWVRQALREDDRIRRGDDSVSTRG